MDINKEQIKTLIIDCLNEVKEINGYDFEINDSLILLGENGALDSMDFVSFTANLQEKLSDISGKNISIVSEKAFSKRYSPFKNIERLSEFALELLKEAE